MGVPHRTLRVTHKLRLQAGGGQSSGLGKGQAGGLETDPEEQIHPGRLSLPALMSRTDLGWPGLLTWQCGQYPAGQMESWPRRPAGWLPAQREAIDLPGGPSQVYKTACSPS